MKSIRIPCLHLFILWTTFIFAPFSSAEPSFNQGVKTYRENQLDQAREHLLNVIKTNPYSTESLYNLGLVEYKLGKKGLALAYWRMALDLGPAPSEVKVAIKFATEELLAKRPLPTPPLWESVRHGFLIPMSFNMSLLAAFGFLFSSIWVLLSHLGKRRLALADDKETPSYPLHGILLWVLAAIFVSGTLLKRLDQRVIRATVVAPSAIVRSSPSAEATNLFELFEGYEVIVRQFRDGWAQITLPGKSSGWVQSEQIVQSSGKFL